MSVIWIKIFWLQDAQNAVAAYALYQLFPDLPIHLAITEPYASFVIRWREGEPSLEALDSLFISCLSLFLIIYITFTLILVSVCE